MLYSKHSIVKKQERKKLKSKLSPQDYEFMNSLSAAMAEQTPKRMRAVLYFWVFAVLFFIIWASFTQIDEITRGDGEVVPSGENQIIQNLEGGIVEEIFVKIGDIVERGDPLLKIDNRKSLSQLSATHIKALELQAKMVRLHAESEGKPFDVNHTIKKMIPELIENERSLYESRQRQFKSSLAVLNDQKEQKRLELNEINQRIVYYKQSEVLITQEVAMMRPMVEQGVKSKVAFMKLQREQNQLQEELHSAELSLPRIESGMSEIDNKIAETTSDFRNQAKVELNEVTAEALRTKESFDALDDQMTRTLVRSPSRGVIEKISVNTVGGVVKPGDNLVEIVPTDATLWMEVKIKPSDIAFVYPGQKAVVKVSAYDFAIYGSLDGEVIHISADTSKDDKENAYYIIHIKTDKNHLGSDEKPLKIIPGMMVNVDIMTGKKSVMDYILKPILRAKQYTFTER